MNEGQGRRRGGREARRQARQSAAAVQRTYITRRIPCTEVLTEEGLEIIEANAETILEEIGIEFRDDEECLALWKDAGADVEGEPGAHVPRGLARAILQTAPREFTQHARNPERSVTHRRRPHRLCAGLRAALRPRPRPGPPLRNDRGFP